jgi:hypothetical protein
MSRTDKDAPLWTRATRWVPEHYGCEFDIGPWYWRKRPHTRDCDLPATPIRAKASYKGFPYAVWERQPRCVWLPDIHQIYKDRLHYGPPPPKWFVDHIGHNMERRRSRDECIQAQKEHRATGDVDVVPTTLQHRHQASWLYW